MNENKLEVGDPYGLAALGSLDMSIYKLATEPGNQFVLEVAHDFASNVIRSYSLAQFVPMITEVSAIDQFYHLHAIHKATGGKLAFQDAQMSETEQISARLAYAQLLQRHNEAVRKKPDEFEVKLWGGGVRRLNELIVRAGQPDPMIAQNIASLLASVAISLWTAAEVCLSDLWVCALNEGPKRLVKKVMKTNLNKGGDTTSQQAKQISMEALDEYGYDFSRKMGTLFRDKGKVDFQSLGSTSIAYQVAFGEEMKNHFDFQNQHYSNLNVLSAVRNLFLHRGGKVDRSFINAVHKSSGTSWNEMAKLPEGGTLTLHGDFIRTAASSVVQFCAAVIRIVDKRMAASDKDDAPEGK